MQKKKNKFEFNSVYVRKIMCFTKLPRVKYFLEKKKLLVRYFGRPDVLENTQKIRQLEDIIVFGGRPLYVSFCRTVQDVLYNGNFQ